jgi:hypothetical protein
MTNFAHTGPAQLAPQKEGATYRCILITPGYVTQQNGQPSNWLIPADALRAAVDLFAVPAYLDHPSRILFGYDDPKVDRLFGMFTNPHWDEKAQGIVADLTLYDEHPNSPGARARELIDRILTDREQGKPIPGVGLSAHLYHTNHLDEETGNRITDEITKVVSIDLVYEPGAGGYIEAALSPIKPKGAEPMPDEQTITLESRLAALEEQIATLQVQTAPPDIPADKEETEDHDQLAALETRVDALSAALANHEEENTIQNMGTPPIAQMRDSLDKVRLATEAMLQGKRPADGVRPLTGIRELYMLMSGDYEMTGRYNPDRIHLANVTSSTMAGIVANALNKSVIQMYAEFPKWWAGAVTEEDFVTMQDVRWITLGGVGELPTVNEGAAYAELTWDDRTETESFVKKGGYLGVTLETIDKDDTRKVQAIPRVLSQGAWLTLGKLIAAIATANSGTGPTMSDSNNLFDNTNHSNLGSSALSHAAWKATKIAMMKHTEVNSDERLGALARPRNLWVPIDLEESGVAMLASANEPGTSDNDINVNAKGDAREARLAAARRRVITVPFWTDTNNWMAQADPNLLPTIGIGYRYGHQPEIFSVASPTAGLMFTNDTMPVKVRFIVAVGPMTWNGLYKHNVS